MSNNEVKFTDKDGNEFNVPLDGSLGLLSTGYKGLMAWRNARQEAGYNLVEIKKAEWEEYVKKENEKRAKFIEQKKEFIDRKKKEKE